VQTSPLGLVARALIRSLPAPLCRRRFTLNEPLGACVVARVRTATAPSRRIVTFHVTPLRFWSTSNSVSIRAPSGLTFSFAVDAPVQWPATRLASPPPCLAVATAGAKAAIARARLTLVLRMLFMASLSGRGGPACNGT
jgi:hypothetical protein